MNSYSKRTKKLKIEDMEKWRAEPTRRWTWNGPAFKSCPVQEKNNANWMLKNLDLVKGEEVNTLDEIPQ